MPGRFAIYAPRNPPLHRFASGVVAQVPEPQATTITWEDLCAPYPDSSSRRPLRSRWALARTRRAARPSSPRPVAPRSTPRNLGAPRRRTSISRSCCAATAAGDHHRRNRDRPRAAVPQPRCFPGGVEVRHSFPRHRRGHRSGGVDERLLSVHDQPMRPVTPRGFAPRGVQFGKASHALIANPLPGTVGRSVCSSCRRGKACAAAKS